MSSTYRYKVNGHWTGGRTGSISPEGVQLPVFFSAPVEFGGEPGHWTPEHMLSAAVASCYLATFDAIAHASMLKFLDLELTVEGTLMRDSEGWRFSEIEIRPTLTLEDTGDSDRALRLLQKAERVCLIARSVAARISVHPEILTLGADLIFAE